MNCKLIILGLVFFPAFGHAQGLDKCPDFVPLPRELNDSFQSFRANLRSADEELKKCRENTNALHKRYMGCENQPGVRDVFKQADELVKAVEINRKNYAEPFSKIEGEIRQIILDAHGRTVECLYLDPNSWAQLGTVVIITYYLDGDTVKILTKNDQLQPAAH